MKRIFNRGIGTFGWVLLCFVLSGAKARTKTKQYKLPNQEEFYSTAEKNISPEARQKADELRLKTLDSIKSLLSSKKNKDAQNFELQLRLGELYAERHDYLRDKEIEDYEQRFNAWVNAGKKGTEPTLSTKQSQAELTNAANAFRNLVRDFPKHKRTAAALYSLGKTLARLGNENAVFYFNQLIKNHKDSPLVTDAYLSMGEYYFEKHDIEKAIDAYKEVIKNKDHIAYTYGVYKLGWAYFNATPKNDQEGKDNVHKSITSFKLVVKLSERDQNKVGRLNLREEAIKDLVMVWAETEDTESAWEYFKTIDESESFYKVLARLGATYIDQGQNKKAIEVYLRLLKEAPTRESNPEIHSKLVMLHDLIGDSKAVVEDLKNMRTLYLNDSKWTKTYSEKPEIIAEAKTTVEKSLHRYGTLYHKNGQKAKDKGMLQTAATIYTLYLDSFATNDNAYEIRFYLADLLFDFNKYEDAAAHYHIVATAKPKDGKYLQVSALNAVVAMKKLDETQKYDKVPPAGQATKVIELPRIKKKLLEALDTFTTLLPADKESPQMMLAAAEILFNYGHYDDAMKRYNDIVEKLPDSKQALVATKIIIGFQMEKRNWDRSTELCRKYLTSKRIKDKDLVKYLQDSLKISLYNQALGLAETKKYAKAGEAFLSFQKEFPEDKNADRALHNAASNYFAASDLENALAANSKLMQQYPKSDLRADAVLDMAQTYEAIARYEEAAKNYREFSTNYFNDKRAQHALYNSAILYKGIGNLAEAEKLLLRFIRVYPRSELATQVSWEICEIQEKLGKYGQAAAGYWAHANQYVKDNRDAYYFALAKAAAITFNYLDEKKGAQDIDELRRLFIKDKELAAFDARSIVASCAFKGVEKHMLAYKQMAIDDPTRIEDQVNKKQKRLVWVARLYQDVIAIGSEEYSVASLYRLGEMHEDFAENLFNAPAPKGASQVDVDNFKSTIEKVAFPLRDDAYKFYETAFKQSQDVETFSDWTRKTYEKMVELAPGKHPAVLEQSAMADYMSHKISIDESVADLAN